MTQSVSAAYYIVYYLLCDNNHLEMNVIKRSAFFALSGELADGTSGKAEEFPVGRLAK